MKILFCTVLVLACLALFAQSSSACSCPKTTFEQEFVNTDFIFVGKVVSITEDTTIKRMPDESRRYVVKLEVVDSFKGARGREIALTQYEIKRHNTSCPNFNLELGETYLIYASRASYTGWDNQKINDIRHQVACSPTQKFRADSPSYKNLVDYRSTFETKKKVVKKKS